MTSKMIMFHVPDDQELLAALGEVALRHEHMNYILRMTIRSLTGVTVDEVVKATERESSSQIRNRIRKLARSRLGEGAPLIKLEAILEDCRRLTEKRNHLIHGLWTQELDGDAQLSGAHGHSPLPTTQELLDLAQELMELTNMLIRERSEGFIYEALLQGKNGSK